MISYTPIVECRYGWGRILRLYHDGLDLEGVYYSLGELERVYPTYHRVLGVSSARLELQFRDRCLIIRGIADVLLAQKIVDYITCGSVVTEAIGAKAVRDACTTAKQIPHFECSSALPAIHYFWEYDANDMPTTVEVIPALSASSLHVSSQSVRSSRSGITGPSVEPWPAMLEGERVERLKRLQAERELRVYGFDVQALSQRLHDGPLPLVLAPLRLFAGETAHYSIEANLCTQLVAPASQEKRQIKDRGKLVLTNRRFIYFGHNRQIVLEYEKIVEVSCLSGAITLSIEQVPQRQFFEMRRPLECSFYLKRLLEDAQSSQYGQKTAGQRVLPASISRPPVADSQPHYPAHDTLKLSLDQLYSTTTTDRDNGDTQKLPKQPGKSSWQM